MIIYNPVRVDIELLDISNERGAHYRVLYAGEILLDRCWCPEYDAARALVAKGITGKGEVWRGGKAARIVREEARSSKPTGLVARSNLASIIKALNVVLTRYNMTRKERRTMIGGQSLPTNDSDNGQAA